MGRRIHRARDLIVQQEVTTGWVRSGQNDPPPPSTELTGRLRAAFSVFRKSEKRRRRSQDRHLGIRSHRTGLRQHRPPRRELGQDDEARRWRRWRRRQGRRRGGQDLGLGRPVERRRRPLRRRAQGGGRGIGRIAASVDKAAATMPRLTADATAMGRAMQNVTAAERALAAETNRVARAGSKLTLFKENAGRPRGRPRCHGAGLAPPRRLRRRPHGAARNPRGRRGGAERRLSRLGRRAHPGRRSRRELCFETSW